MSGPFGATSTTDDVLAGVDLTGKRILVTGVSAGLGVETARVLAAHGAQVVGAARDLDKARGATEVVRTQAAKGGGLELVALDLADLASVRACADALVADGRPFDIIINNAGVMATPFGHTKDGFETQFGTNHLGHFVLVNRLAKLLGQGSRVVALSSSGHRFSDVNLEDPNFEHTDYTPFGAYGRSKTANALFAVEFDRRHRERGVRAASVHPGGIQTELARHMPPEAIQQMIDQITKRGDKTIPQGAATSVWAGVVASADDVGGKAPRPCGPRAKPWSARRSRRSPIPGDLYPRRSQIESRDFNALKLNAARQSSEILAAPYCSHPEAREGTSGRRPDGLLGVIERGHRSGECPGRQLNERTGDVNLPIGGKPRPPPVRRFVPGPPESAWLAASGLGPSRGRTNPDGGTGLNETRARRPEG
jgi:NAD(P)-dependent dehydrogenase (short-subunit alcohol dehydrogenase family)